MNNPEKKFYSAIEGVRGILAMIVCSGHYGFEKILPSFLFYNIHFAVDIFFIISGFVLASSSYLISKSKSFNSQSAFFINSQKFKPNFYHFFVKRFSRLYPLHFITLMLVLAIFIIKKSPIYLDSLFINIFLLQNIFFEENYFYNFPSWSIGIELWLSVLFYYLTYYLNPKFFLSLIVSCLIGVSFLAPEVLMSATGGKVYFFTSGLMRGFVGFGIGIIVYRAINHNIFKSFFANKKYSYLASIILFLFLFLKLPNYCAFLFYICSFYLMGSLIQCPDFYKLLKTKLLTWLGSISYSIYLLHIPLYYTMQMIFGDESIKGLKGKLILIPLTLIVSSISYSWVEKPLQKKLLILLPSIRKRIYLFVFKKTIAA